MFRIDDYFCRKKVHFETYKMVPLFWNVCKILKALFSLLGLATNLQVWPKTKNFFDTSTLVQCLGFFKLNSSAVKSFTFCTLSRNWQGDPKQMGDLQNNDSF